MLFRSSSIFLISCCFSSMLCGQKSKIQLLNYQEKQWPAMDWSLVLLLLFPSLLSSLFFVALPKIRTIILILHVFPIHELTLIKKLYISRMRHSLCCPFLASKAKVQGSALDSTAAIQEMNASWLLSSTTPTVSTVPFLQGIQDQCGLLIGTLLSG